MSVPTPGLLQPSPEHLDPGRVVEVDADVGSIWLERDAELMTPSVIENGFWAPELTGFMRDALRPGMTVVDVGANIGYFSVLASKLVGSKGRVICVEVDPDNVEILRANLWKNGCSNASVLQVAAWDETTQLTLRTNPAGGAGSYVDATSGDASVLAVRLDEVIEGPVHYMKVDCESTDHMVVSGAAGLIRAKPTMVMTVEFNPGHTSHTGHPPGQILDLYRGLDLRPYAIRINGRIVPTDFTELAASRSGEGETIFDFVLCRRLPLRLLSYSYRQRFYELRLRRRGLLGVNSA